MTSLVIPDLDETVLEHLRRRADARGRSPGEEARTILREALEASPTALPASDISNGQRLVDLARELFGPKNGVDLVLPSREIERDPPRFD